MTYPFTAPVRLREFGKEVGQSYWSIRRLVRSGVAPVAQFPDGQKILPEWANRYRDYGLNPEEAARYREYMREQREAGRTAFNGTTPPPEMTGSSELREDEEIEQRAAERARQRRGA